jgi:hypothetical protein
MTFISIVGYLVAIYFLDQNQFEKSLEAHALCLKSAAEAGDSM